MRKLFVTVIMIAGFCLITINARAETYSAVVISDTSNKNPSGTVLKPDDLIVLSKNHTISLVLSDGKTKTISGPFRGLAQGVNKAPSKTENWKNMLTNLIQRHGSSSVIGGVREIGVDFRVEYPENSETQKICVTKDVIISNVSERENLTIRSPLTGIAVIIPSNNEIKWPSFFAKSGSYSFSMNSVGFQRSDISVMTKYSLSTLAENGCEKQYNTELTNIISSFVQREN